MVVRGLYTWALDHDGVLLFLTRAAVGALAPIDRRSNLDASRSAEAVLERMLLSFQRPSRHPCPGDSRSRNAGQAHRRPPSERGIIALLARAVTPVAGGGA